MGLSSIFGTHSTREIKRIMPIVNKVMSLEEEYGKLTDEELVGKTQIFKESSCNPQTNPAEIGAVVAEGEVVIGFIKSDTRRPCRIPGFAAEIMEKYF